MMRSSSGGRRLVGRGRGLCQITGTLVLALCALALRVGSPSAVSEAVTIQDWDLLGGTLDVPRNGLTGEAVGGFLYAMGGVVYPGGPGYAQSVVSLYNPALDDWSDTLVDPMPTARHSLSSTVIGDQIYAVGGHVGNSRLEVERYDAAMGTWTSLAPLQTARSGAGVAAYDGQVYVFGGNRYGTVQSSIERYDPATNTWSYVGSAPNAIDPWRAVTFGDKMYMVGAGLRSGTGKEVWSYDAESGAWDTALPSMNVARAYPELVVADGRIYAIGGAWAGSVLNSVESWAPGEESWTVEPSMEVGRMQFASAAIGSNIYVFGGANASGDLGSAEQTALSTWRSEGVKLAQIVDAILTIAAAMGQLPGPYVPLVIDLNSEPWRTIVNMVPGASQQFSGLSHYYAELLCDANLSLVDGLGRTTSSAGDGIPGTHHFQGDFLGDGGSHEGIFFDSAWWGSYSLAVTPETGADPCSVFTAYFFDPYKDTVTLFAYQEPLGTSAHLYEVHSVPEPGTFLLLGASLTGLLLVRRERARA